MLSQLGAFIDDPIVVVEVGHRGPDERSWGELRHACRTLVFDFGNGESPTVDQWCEREGIGTIDVLDVASDAVGLQVLEGATHALRTVRALRVAVQLNPVDETPPRFGEIDRYLRDRGFVLWRFGSLSHRAASDTRALPLGSARVTYGERVIPYPVYPGQLRGGEALYVAAAVAGADGTADWRVAVRDAACAAGIGLLDVATTRLRQAITPAGPELGAVLALIVSDPVEPHTTFAEHFSLAPETVIAQRSVPLREPHLLTMDQQFEGGGWRAPEQHTIGPLRWTGPGRDAWIDLPFRLGPGTRVELVVVASMAPELVPGLELEVNRTPVELTVTPSGPTLKIAGVLPHDYVAPRQFTRLLLRVPYTVPWQQLHPGTDADLEIGVAVSSVLLVPPGMTPADVGRAPGVEPNGAPEQWSVSPAPSTDASPPLSVIIPTTRRWPAIAPALDVLAPQAAACGAEIVVVDGDGRALGDDVPACVTRVAAPGRDAFALRAIGITAARGRIVAVTEDHCIARDDFCSNVLRAHRENPHNCVAGAVVNGSPDAAIDRANFLVVHGDNLPGSSVFPPPRWIPTASNVSYKRTVLPEAEPAMGWLEIVLNPTLLLRGEVAWDERIVVRHVQSTGRFGTFANHFRAGRSTAGLARGFVARGHRVRWCTRSAVALGPHIVRRIWRIGRERPEERGAIYRLLPLVAGLALADTIGFVTGALTGPGRSAARLR